MINKFETTEILINEICLKIPLIEKDDLSILTEILQNLESVNKELVLPKALKNQALRTARLVEHIIMEETNFSQGVVKLGQSVEKMGRALHDLKNNPIGNLDKENEKYKTYDDTSNEQSNISKNQEGFSEEFEKKDSTNEGQNRIPEDIKDLVLKFVSAQQAVIEDFEAYILEFEKGAPQAKNALKRILHTWKGEFGVLDLQEYSQLIHDVEEALENSRLTADNLFKLSDLLTEKMKIFAQSIVPPIIEQEFAAILGESYTTKKESQAKDQASSENSDTTGNIILSASSVMVNREDRNQEFTINGDPALIADFITESQDHIHTAETCLLDLEVDISNADHLNSIFRSCHTIKGVAGFLGLKDVSELSHSIENLMDLARRGRLQLNSGHIDLLFESLDCLKELISSIKAVTAGDTYRLPKIYQDVITKLSKPEKIIQKTPLSSNASHKKVGEILVENGMATSPQIEEALNLQNTGDRRKVGQILVEQGYVKAKNVGNALAMQNAAQQSNSVNETIRVPVERLDQLVDAIGEAVISHSMIAADPLVINLKDQGVEKKIAHANTIMRKIQELSMSLRMVSLKSTFQKMARLVRDLSKKSGKEVEFILEGEDTELDKSVVENIGDPLIHMIRNAIDHGIEDSAEERVKKGKPAKARVVLRAFHKAGSIYIEIEDDGKGIDKEMVRKKALAENLCKETDKYTDQEIYQFIFMPGFSTAKKITDVSGRGVGMDVVKRNIQALRGSVEIQSEPDKGTTFSIRLPLTLAIIDGMIVRLEKEKYIIPLLSIIESIKPKKEQVESVANTREMINVRGNLIEFVRLAKLLGSNDQVKNVEEGIVIIVEDMIGKQIAMLVDEIIGQQQVVIKNLGAVGDIQGISGGAIMSDGNVSLIIDIGGIVKMASG